MRSRTTHMTRLALMTAVLCIIAPLQLPAGAVPVTLQTFAIALTGALLGARHGAAAVIAYLLLGAVGLPVFSGWTGGIGAFAGPTGGFLTGFPLMALLCGCCRTKPLPLHILSALTGLLLTDALGALHLMRTAGMTLSAALIAGVWPFLAKDIACVILALIAARKIAARLRI